MFGINGLLNSFTGFFGGKSNAREIIKETDEFEEVEEISDNWEVIVSNDSNLDNAPTLQTDVAIPTDNPPKLSKKIPTHDAPTYDPPKIPTQTQAHLKKNESSVERPLQVNKKEKSLLIINKNSKKQQSIEPKISVPEPIVFRPISTILKGLFKPNNEKQTKDPVEIHLNLDEVQINSEKDSSSSDEPLRILIQGISSDEQILPDMTQETDSDDILETENKNLQAPKTDFKRKVNYSITLKRDHGKNININEEDLSKLNKYFKTYHEDFCPIIESISTEDQPLHYILSKITKDQVSSYEQLTFSEKINHSEKIIRVLLFFLMEEPKATSKATLLQIVISSPQGDMEFSTFSKDELLQLESVEIALRRYFMYEILNQEKINIHKTLVIKEDVPKETKNILDELYKLATDNGCYEFDRSNIFKILDECGFDEISKIILTTCEKLSGTKKIKFLEEKVKTTIKKINEFRKKIDKSPEEPSANDFHTEMAAIAAKNMKVNQAKAADTTQQEDLLRTHLLREMVKQIEKKVSNKIAKHSRWTLSDKIQLYESAIEELKSFEKKDMHTPRSRKKDNWAFYDSQTYGYTLRALEEPSRRRLFSQIVDQEKKRISEYLIAHTQFPKDFEERCRQLYLFVSKNNANACTLSIIYQALIDEDSLNKMAELAAKDDITNGPNNAHFLSSSEFLTDLKRYTDKFNRFITTRLQTSHPADSFHPKHIFESKLRVKLAFWLSLQFAEAFHRELYTPIAIPPTKEDFEEALVQLSCFITGNTRFPSHNIKTPLLQQIFISLSEIQAFIESEQKKPTIPHSDGWETLNELIIHWTTTPEQLATQKIATLQWAKEEWKKTFPGDVLPEENSRIPVANTQEEIAQPVIQPTTQPVAQPTIQPTTQPNTQPTTQPVAQPTIQPTTQPNTHPVAQPVATQPTSRKKYKANDLNIPSVSYVDLAFKEHLAAKQADDASLFYSLPQIVQIDVLHHVCRGVSGKAEEAAGRLFKQMPKIQEQLEILKKKNLVGKSALSETFVREGEKLLALYYSPEWLKINFAHHLQALPHENLLFQYIYEMAQEAGVHVETGDYNFAENNWTNLGMIKLSMQALERCLHTSVVTEIKIRCDVPLGHSLKIHGEGGDLDWTSGHPLIKEGEGVYVYHMEGVKEQAKYKLVLDNGIWESGDDHTVKAGTSQEITPNLILPSKPSIVVYYKGEGELFIRGEGPGMNWECGEKLKNIGNGVFLLEGKSGDYPFKILRNNENWMLEDDAVAKSGTTVEVRPSF
jgi:hypothetical protein